MAIAERIEENAALRKAYANLREACAFAIDPRKADRDLAGLLSRFVEGGCRNSPLSPHFGTVLAYLPEEGRTIHVLQPGSIQTSGLEALIAEGVRDLLKELLGRELGTVQILDPWAANGEIIAPFEAGERFANEADPVRYAELVDRLGRGAVFADSFRLPERVPTPGFDFTDDENIHRLNDQQSVSFSVIVSDLRRATQPDSRARRRTKDTWGEGIVAVRWMADRLAPSGVIAFVSEREFVDDPSSAAFRAGLMREFESISHVALPNGVGLTFLVRGATERQIRYAKVDTLPVQFEEIAWQILEPTPNQVWRREILSEDWPNMPPLAEERGAVFRESSRGLPDGIDTLAPRRKAHRVLRSPFVSTWRTLARKSRGDAALPQGPMIVLLSEPFGVLASNVLVDQRFGGTGSTVLALGGRVNAEALRRFRASYGAAVTERDVFDAALALLHHPEYRVRYHEDLRRSVARLPLPKEDSLAALLTHSDAPPVGPGTAFRMGWVDGELFEPGTVPDYDDPFASPYARDDIDPGFLLLAGLGSALYQVQVGFERFVPFSLTALGEPNPFERMRFSKDRSRLSVGPTQVLDGIPPESLEHRIGRWSAPEWVVEGLRRRGGFDPNLDNDLERPGRLFAQAITSSLETRRLTAIVGTIRL